MAFDQGLAQRLRDIFEDQSDVEEKKMFGGLCFMVSNHMCCGIQGETLMARVGPKNYEKCLARENTREMDFTGRPLKGMIYVTPAGIESDLQLNHWVSLCLDFVASLPPKKPK